MDILEKPSQWLDVLSAMEVYEKKPFHIHNLATIRSTLSTTVKDKHPERIYKTRTEVNTITVERLK